MVDKDKKKSSIHIGEHTFAVVVFLFLFLVSPFNQLINSPLLLAMNINPMP